MDHDQQENRRAMSEAVGDSQSSGSSGDKFSGVENYQAWKRKWKVQLLAEDDLTPLQKAKKLFKHVVGTASMHLLADVDEDAETFPFNTPAQIFAILDNNYASAGGVTQADAAAELMGLRQGRGSVADYTTKFEMLAPIAKIAGESKIACYLRGLTREINTTIGVNAPATWPLAVRAARRAEELNGGHRAYPRGHTPRGRGGGRGGGTRPQPGRQANEQRTCWICADPNHMARECPQQGRSNRGGRGSRGGGGRAPGRQSRTQPEPVPEEEPEWEFELTGNE